MCHASFKTLPSLPRSDHARRLSTCSPLHTALCVPDLPTYFVTCTSCDSVHIAGHVEFDLLITVHSKLYAKKKNVITDFIPK
jgi:hypothetical protein